MKKDSPKKISALDKYVIFSIGFTILYTIVEFIFSICTGTSHDTLTTCVYAFFAGEIVTSGLIKIFKLKGENKDEKPFDEP